MSYYLNSLPHQFLNPIDKERQKIINILTRVRGIGPVTANDLYDRGIRTIEELNDIPGLSNVIKISAKYVDDLETLIPRETTQEIIQWVRTLFDEVIGVGSYRRGKDMMHDVDVLIISDTITVKDIVEKIKKTDKFVYLLGIGGYKTEILIDGDHKMLLDIYTAPKNEKGAALMHTTGSGKWNIIMRTYAKIHGFKLSQHGLFKDDVLIASKTEKDIFDGLKLKFIPPALRTEAVRLE